MARALAKLLGRADDRLFLRTIEELEMATGHKGIDVRLVGEVLHQAHVAIKTLGLDSADSTALEVYNALRANGPGKETPAFTGVIVHDRCISLHKKDLRLDADMEAQFSNRSIGHMQKALLGELKQRYKKAAGEHNLVATRLLASL